MTWISLFKGFLLHSGDGLSHIYVRSFSPGLSQLSPEGSSCFDFCLGQDDLEDLFFLSVGFLRYYLSSYSDFLGGFLLCPSSEVQRR